MEIETTLVRAQQGLTSAASVQELGLPVDFDFAHFQGLIARELPGRKIPDVYKLSEFRSASLLEQRAVPLPTANTLSHVNFRNLRFGHLQTGTGRTLLFNPEIVLIKIKNQPHVMAVRVEPEQELLAARHLAAREDVEFAELDVLERRSVFKVDPLATNQWHHQIIGSYLAWEKSFGRSFVRIAIVDTPFQMNHPDLAANTANGWDVLTAVPVTASSGIAHSTLGAGMAAAVIGNGLGVAGASNCRILPINISGFRSEMYDAVIWAADNDVRVVNISWSGGDSDTLNAAGAYLKSKARGIMAMSAGNLGAGQYATNQPDIWCISMTDAAGEMRSLVGPQVDFAAPGWQVFSTTTGDGYDLGYGTSFSTPLFCGVVAVLFSINPTLSPEEVIGILKNTAVDSGAPGWDPSYGWGRIDFGAAAAAAMATLPMITDAFLTNGELVLSTSYRPGLIYSLWRTPTLTNVQWTQVTNAFLSQSGGEIFLRDPSPPGGIGFYRISVDVP